MTDTSRVTHIFYHVPNLVGAVSKLPIMLFSCTRRAIRYRLILTCTHFLLTTSLGQLGDGWKFHDSFGGTKYTDMNATWTNERQLTKTSNKQMMTENKDVKQLDECMGQKWNTNYNTDLLSSMGIER